MANYRKRPIEIEAVEIIDVLGNQDECQIAVSSDADWFREAMKKSVGEAGGVWVLHDRLCVGTLEGTMRANVGDFIVRGISGELYPVKRDIFEQTYDLIN